MGSTGAHLDRDTHAPALLQPPLRCHLQLMNRFTDGNISYGRGSRTRAFNGGLPASHAVARSKSMCPRKTPTRRPTAWSSSSRLSSISRRHLWTRELAGQVVECHACCCPRAWACTYTRAKSTDACNRRAAFRAYMGSGDKDTIFAILKWVAPQPQELQKRAFVGYYLSFPDVSGAVASCVWSL